MRSMLKRVQERNYNYGVVDKKVTTPYGYVNLVVDKQYKMDDNGDPIEDEDGQPIEEDYIRLDYVEIYPQYRNQGHAKELVKKAIQEAKRYRLPIYLVAHEYDSDVIPLNDLVSFYKKMGFYVVGDWGGIVMKY
jgi:GNAT superfamily N-acetyltransferase